MYIWKSGTVQRAAQEHEAEILAGKNKFGGLQDKEMESIGFERRSMFSNAFGGSNEDKDLREKLLSKWNHEEKELEVTK